MSAPRTPLRVLYSFPHALDWPGIATTALNEVRALARRGAIVELYCTSRGEAALPATVRVVQTMVVAGRRIPHRALGVQRAYSRHDRIVARRIERGPRPDVVHTWPRGCLQTLIAARRLGVPGLRECPNPHTASVYHESARAAADAGVPLPSGHSHAASAAVLALEEREFEAAAALLVPSAYAAERFVAEGIAEERMLRHRYGCDLARFSPGERKPDRPLHACFLGRGDPTKGLHVALRAWRDAGLPAGSTLSVAGAIEARYRTSLSDALAHPGVRVLGFVADTPALLRESDVLLLPSWTEGSALVTYEAQASGCLPLVSRASGAHGEEGDDFLSHAVGDVATLTAQLSGLAAAPSRLAERRRSLIDHREQYSWDAAGAVLEECYRTAFSRAGVPS